MFFYIFPTYYSEWILFTFDKKRKKRCISYYFLIGKLHNLKTRLFVALPCMTCKCQLLAYPAVLNKDANLKTDALLKNRRSKLFYNDLNGIRNHVNIVAFKRLLIHEKAFVIYRMTADSLRIAIVIRKSTVIYI